LSQEDDALLGVFVEFLDSLDDDLLEVLLLPELNGVRKTFGYGSIIESLIKKVDVS
jgi:hypothetical protein